MNNESFIEWERLLHNISDFNEHTSAYFHNAPYVLQKCRDLLQFMKKETPVLRQWCDEYLEKNRNEIFIKYWTEYGYNFLNGYNRGINNIRFISKAADLHPEFLRCWKQVSDVFCSEDGCLDVDFNSAYSLLHKTNEIHSTCYCTIPEILAIHKGRECSSNGWYCDYCEELEDRWHKYLTDTLKNEKNIFLNKGVKERFLERAIGIPIVSEGWKPPGMNPWEIMQSHMSYQSAPISPQTQTTGKTAYQLMYKIVEFAEWKIRIWRPFKTEFEKFCSLWVFLETLEPNLIVLEKACDEVEKICR
jgi:hypothetical protein